MEFSHPLARGAKIWLSYVDGQEKRLLVVVTTLHLDRANNGYKDDKVSRLTGAVQEWMSDHPTEAQGYILVNRLKDW